MDKLFFRGILKDHVSRAYIQILDQWISKRCCPNLWMLSWIIKHNSNKQRLWMFMVDTSYVMIY